MEPSCQPSSPFSFNPVWAGCACGIAQDYTAALAACSARFLRLPLAVLVHPSCGRCKAHRRAQKAAWERQGRPDYIHDVDLSHNLAHEIERRSNAVAMRKKAWVPERSQATFALALLVVKPPCVYRYRRACVS